MKNEPQKPAPKPNTPTTPGKTAAPPPAKPGMTTPKPAPPPTDRPKR